MMNFSASFIISLSYIRTKLFRVLTNFVAIPRPTTTSKLNMSISIVVTDACTKLMVDLRGLFQLITSMTKTA